MVVCLPYEYVVPMCYRQYAISAKGEFSLEESDMISRLKRVGSAIDRCLILEEPAGSSVRVRVLGTRKAGLLICRLELLQACARDP